MKKNDIIILDIVDINEDGDGIGRFNGQVFFVKGALVGERIEAGITALKKNYGYARIINILEASPERVKPLCALNGKCGGCSLMHASYKAQLEYKQKRVRDCFVRIGGFSEDKIQKALNKTVGMDVPYRYRNKAQYPVGIDKDGNLIAGFYGKRSHRIVPTDDCKIGHEKDCDILKTILSWAKKNKITAYDEKSQKGLIRHILIRHSSIGETMVVLVINGNKLSKYKELITELEPLGITSICVNKNKKNTNVILGEETECIYGDKTIRDEYTVTVGEKENIFKVNISAESFFQVNHEQMEKLYSIAMEYAELSGEEYVWDLYCGIGTITMPLATAAKQVLGIEYVDVAISDAKENAKTNNLNNIKFYVGAAEDILSRKQDFGPLTQPQVVVLDPPRAGCDQAVLDAIKNASPNRIVYVSCNPATLARDCKLLCQEGIYEISKITPVDQFCHGGHVETVVLMSKVK